MGEGFEGWVRVLCAGPLAFASSAAAAIPNWPLAATCGGLAIAFAIWPERLAYAFRKNRFVPSWSTPVSIVGRNVPEAGSSTGTFATYRPKLMNLCSAYFSVGWYVAFGFEPWRLPAMYLPFLFMAGVTILLWLLARSER